MAAPLHQGERLGPFLLEGKIAVGGMAEVWSARRPDDREPRRYAIKILLEMFQRDEALRKMFIDEVRLTKRLRHPNIVRVEGEYEDRGLIFQVMELIDGKDLRRLLAHLVKTKGKLPVALAAWIAREAARGLGYAHGARSPEGQPLEIVHRDVSPHNILVDREGGVRVLDFGVARAKERLTRTAAGVIKGKIAYMAPEQMLAEPVTAQSDIFALGIVLWEMLATRRLFGGVSDGEIFAAVCEARVPPIREKNAGVSAGLAEIVHAMLALKPRNRPESMRAVENALTRELVTTFSEGEASPQALALVIAPVLDAPKRRTAVLPVPLQHPAPLQPRGPVQPPAPVATIPDTVTAADPRPVEDAAMFPTEALEVGEGFFDELRDPAGDERTDLQETLRISSSMIVQSQLESAATAQATPEAPADLSDTLSDPYGLARGAPSGPTAPPAEVLPPTERYSIERRRELADTQALRGDEIAALARASLSVPPEAFPAGEPGAVANPVRRIHELRPAVVGREGRPSVPAPPRPAPSQARALWVLSIVALVFGAILLLARALSS
ncbi:MAG: protein kinase [Deltaproteobacteria bacterium]|nr:protein kinase [Deltaproteobacteria bacterium]